MFSYAVLLCFLVFCHLSVNAQTKTDFKVDSIPRPLIEVGLDSLDLDFTDIDSCERITLKLNLSSKGFIKNAVVVANRTFCDDQEAIENMLAIIREKVKYNEQPGVYDRVVYLTIRLHEGEE
jgi:hypothetical protein